MPLHTNWNQNYIILAINQYGLVEYVERRGQLPSLEFIAAYHQHVKTFFARNKPTLNLNGSYPIIVHNEMSF